jgi:murein DD-endopeptidase MepM/ murein hydrolase activator NlpD
VTTARTKSIAGLVLGVLVAACMLASPDAAEGATAAQLAAQVRALDSQVAEAGRAYDAAYWRLHETELRLERLEASLAQTEADLAEAERHLSSRAAAMYRRAEDDVISFLLGSRSFQEMATRAMLWDRIAAEDARIVSETNKLRDTYEIEVAAVEQERERQAADAAALKRQVDSLESQLASKRAEYDRLQAELEAAIAEEAARNRVTYVRPSSANGMTFPVAGASYYSNTWGASRSGGRRSHKGADIMASRGTPCVAVLPGTVQAKSSGLGGKTIWLTADNGWKFYYAHLDGWSVTSGRVSQGQVIGTVGSTGNASYGAPHLHFEIHPGGGSAVNPYPYLRAMQGY